MKYLVFFSFLVIGLNASAFSKDCDFKFHKLGSYKEAEAFLATLKSVKNSKQFARYVQFPFRANLKPKPLQIKNRTELNKHFKALMSDSVRSAIHYTDPKKFYCNSDGLMLGKGNVWLTYKKKQYKIIAINP